MNIKSFFQNLKAKVKAFFVKIFPKAKTAIHWGIEVTEKLNTALSTPLTDVVTFLIPGDYDDKIVAILRTKLPKILIGLNLVDKALESKDASAIIEAAMKELQAKEGLFKDAYLHTLAVAIATAASDGELTWSEVASIMEEAYQEYKK